MIEGYRREVLAIIGRSARLIAIFTTIWVVATFLSYLIVLAVRETSYVNELSQIYQSMQARLGTQPTIGVYLYRNLGTTVINYIGAPLFVELLTFLRALYVTPFFWAQVVKTSSLYHQDPLLVYIVVVSPHGIFEIPAIIFEMALTFRISLALFKSGTLRKRVERLKNAYRDALTALPIIIVALIIGAVVEVKVTPLIARLILRF